MMSKNPEPSSDQDEQPANLSTIDLQPEESKKSRPVVIAIRDLTKTYHLGGSQVYALRGVTLKVESGEFVAIMGPSGSGKSTMMNLIGCLDRPTSGDYWLTGMPVSQMSPDVLADMRNRRIGFVFQGFNLLARDTALQNVMLPLMYGGLPRQSQEQRAYKALQMLGLGGHTKHRPAQLSGGQQQRVAIARALVNEPSLLLADEPTGNLDSHTGLGIMQVLQTLNEQGVTVVLVTHDPSIAAYAKRQVLFLDGRVVHDEPIANPRSARAEWLEQQNRSATLQLEEGTHE